MPVGECVSQKAASGVRGNGAELRCKVSTLRTFGKHTRVSLRALSSNYLQPPPLIKPAFPAPVAFRRIMKSLESMFPYLFL